MKFHYANVFIRLAVAKTNITYIYLFIVKDVCNYCANCTIYEELEYFVNCFI